LYFSFFPQNPLKHFLSHFDGNTENERTGFEGTSSGISFDNGKYGKGVKFENPTDQLNYPTSGNIDRTQGTIEFWWIPSLLSDTNDFPLFTYARSKGEWENTINIRNNEEFVEVIFYRDTSPSYIEFDISSWSEGEAHHIAVAWDANSLNVYADGVLQSSLSTPINTPSVDRDRFYIGEEILNSNPSSALGVIDEFIIFNDVRSEPEILSDFQRTSGFFQEPTSPTLTPTLTVTPVPTLTPTLTPTPTPTLTPAPNTIKIVRPVFPDFRQLFRQIAERMIIMQSRLSQRFNPL